MSTTNHSQPTLATLMTQLEELWGHIDTLLNPLTSANWQRKHGKDWVFADLPYHLAYYDLDTVATPILKGSNISKSEQTPMQTMGELDAWNARKFAERPTSQTVSESVAQMQAARAAVRKAVATFDDSDLDQRVWIPLVGMGWVNVRMALLSCLVHNWAHFTEARLRLNKTAPLPSAAITHMAVGFFMGMMPMIMDRAQAGDTRFTAHMRLNGLGGGDWTIRVVKGLCRVSEEVPAQADLTMHYQSPEVFVQMMRKMSNPLWLMLTGKIKVQGFGAMGTFGKLFAEPQPDRVLQPLMA